MRLGNLYVLRRLVRSPVPVIWYWNDAGWSENAEDAFCTDSVRALRLVRIAEMRRDETVAFDYDIVRAIGE